LQRMNASRLEDILFGISRDGFEQTALTLYRMQARENKAFFDFHRFLGHDAASVQDICQIRFLPVTFFKTHHILCNGLHPSIEFSSSTTTGSVPGVHAVADPGLYEQVFMKAFKDRYGKPENTVVLALLPSYLERSGSSLIYMVNHIIRQSANELSGFFLDRLDNLRFSIDEARKTGQRIILFTVTFALLQLAEIGFDLTGVIVIETGGMKGRGRELIREELVSRVKYSCGPLAVDSEYGMTELLSQAYSGEDGWLKAPVWMKPLVRDSGDPFLISKSGRGLLNIIDLANADSCAFIATDDLTELASEKFRILGRADYSDIRGCNLMLSFA